jgi:hypothetical protein
VIGVERSRDGLVPGEWLNLDEIAEVELTSEDAAHPVESALSAAEGSGWRAGEPGEQLLRLVFDEPVRLGRIRLVFEEVDEPRTQEFALRWSGGRGEPTRDVVRQQYTFHPPDNTREVEEYRVELSGVRVLELAIVPDISGGRARASLRSMLVGE